jgi:hypothetical protein
MVSIGPLKLLPPAPNPWTLKLSFFYSSFAPINVGTITVNGSTTTPVVFGPMSRDELVMIVFTNTNTTPTTVVAEDSSSFQMVLFDLGIL